MLVWILIILLRKVYVLLEAKTLELNGSSAEREAESFTRTGTEVLAGVCHWAWFTRIAPLLRRRVHVSEVNVLDLCRALGSQHDHMSTHVRKINARGLQPWTAAATLARRLFSFSEATAAAH